MYGIAVENPSVDISRFREGSKAFTLYPARHLDDESEVVVVALGRAVDHGSKETTVFQARGRSCGPRSPELLRPQLRVLDHDIDQALANLAGGYVEVAAEELEELKKQALETAKFRSKKDLLLTEEQAEKYAYYNWGSFAADIVKTRQPVLSMKSNTVNWRKLKDSVPHEFLSA